MLPDRDRVVNSASMAILVKNCGFRTTIFCKNLKNPPNDFFQIFTVCTLGPDVSIDISGIFGKTLEKSGFDPKMVKFTKNQGFSPKLRLKEPYV